MGTLNIQSVNQRIVDHQKSLDKENFRRRAVELVQLSFPTVKEFKLEIHNRSTDEPSWTFDCIIDGQKLESNLGWNENGFQFSELYKHFQNEGIEEPGFQLYTDLSDILSQDEILELFETGYDDLDEEDLNTWSYNWIAFHDEVQNKIFIWAGGENDSELVLDMLNGMKVVGEAVSDHQNNSNVIREFDITDDAF